MDRNMLIGLLLMGLVIFGFTMLQSSPEEAASAATETTQVDKGKDAVQETAIDSLSQKDLQRMATIVQQYGQLENRSGKEVMALNYENVTLQLDGGVLSGVVTMQGDMVYMLDDLKGQPAAGDRLKQQAIKDVKQAAEMAARYAGFSRFIGGEEKTARLENNLITLDLTSKGAMIAKATLKKYTALLNGKEGPAVIFNKESNNYGFAINTSTHRFDTREFNFIPVQENDSTVLMKLDFGEGIMFGVRYTLPANSYLVRMEVVQTSARPATTRRLSPTTSSGLVSRTSSSLPYSSPTNTSSELTR